jgi:ribosome-binding protein aMBF1 (putative translation factor)
MSKLPSQEKMSPSLRKALTGKPRMVRVDSSAAKTLIELTPEKLEDFERSLNRAEPVGTLLAQARKAKGFNQRQAAQFLNRNHSRIAALEHPKPETAFSSLVQYAEALGYKVSLKLEDQKGGQTFEVKL